MNYDFIITLRRPGFKAINIISQLLLLIYLIAFTRLAVQLGFSRLEFIEWIIPALTLGLWIYIKIRSREKDFQTYYRLPLIMSALGWVLLSTYGVVSVGMGRWFAVFYALMGLAERFIKFPNEIGFTKTQVVHNSFPKKYYEWVEIENAMIRDNIFTLDLRNNKLIQKELDEPVSKELEKEFNEFCREQLHFSLTEVNDNKERAF